MIFCEVCKCPWQSSEMADVCCTKIDTAGFGPSVTILPIVPGVGPDATVVTNEKGAKQSATKYRCDLLPPTATLKVAEVLSQGAEKYGIDNWRGIPVEDHINHAMIHQFAYLAGDRSDDHLSHAACRMLMALEMQVTEVHPYPGNTEGSILVNDSEIPF